MKLQGAVTIVIKRPAAVDLHEHRHEGLLQDFREGFNVGTQSLVVDSVGIRRFGQGLSCGLAPVITLWSNMDVGRGLSDMG